MRPPPIPALHATHAGIWLAGGDGEVREASRGEAIARAAETPHIILNAPLVGQRLGYPELSGLDLLELFAFIHPARFAVPTAAGLSRALGLDPPASEAEAARKLQDIAERLLATFRDPDWREREGAWTSNATLHRLGWGWGPLVGAQLERPERGERMLFSRLKQWDEAADRPPPRTVTVGAGAARQKLDQLTGRVECREGQRAMAEAVTSVFEPKRSKDAPNLLLAEAGTGIGKTLAYLAPASIWAEQSGGTVWVSTFTKALQRQLDAEGPKLFANVEERTRKIVVRKGRENYLCLLNYEEAVGALPARPATAVGVGLMARWIQATRDGSLVGGDFPGWLPDLLGRGRTLGLADRRGECIHSACPHYHKCFIEKSVRRARRARLVVANHALVMVQAAWGGLDDSNVPTRYVFDEGHHVFEAADNAFSLALTGREAVELRRWVLGVEGGRGRARGLRRRLEELIAGDDAAERALTEAQAAARTLPGESWLQRLQQGAPYGEAEILLAHVRRQVLARAEAADNAYSLETEARPPVEGLLEAAAGLGLALRRLVEPLDALAKRLGKRLDDEAAELDAATRTRIDAAQRSLRRRIDGELAGWLAMLKDLGGEPAAPLVDWFAVDRIDGHEIDVGIHRHWIDPTRPFVETVAKPAQGFLVTSATLTDGTGDPEADWAAAEMLTGARHLQRSALRARVPSPFDYGAQTRVFVVTDVKREEVDQVAAAYRELFLAAGGGALGLFTAISRLKAVYARIAAALEAANLPLLAQHVDAMDTATLVDIFRAEEDASLLGTDAVRDGVDVPGRSLRLIVFDRVPWPRPDILHKARRQEFGGARYDDRITRLRLRQAFGRLVRRAGDTGVFALLDSRLPSRLLGAFPEGVAVERVGLKHAIEQTREFLKYPVAASAS